MANPTKGTAKTSDNKDLLVHILRLDEIDAKSYKNSRSGGWLEGSGAEEDNDFKGLCESIEARGQDEPITVRPHGKGKKLQLVAGFRRYAAHKKLGKETIKAFIRELDDNEARALNIRENTARNDLSGPDLAWAVWDLYKGYQAQKRPITAQALAAEIGRNQSYVNSLINIMSKLPGDVTDHWRASEKQLPVKAMSKLADLKDGDSEATPDQKKKAYEEAFKAKSGEGNTTGRGIAGLVKRAKEQGDFLGTLQRLKLITSDLDFTRDLDKLVKMPADPITDEERREVAKAAEGAFVAALEYVEPPPPAEGEAPAEGNKGRKGRKGATAAPAESAPN